MLKKYTIYGERCSGTTYLEQLINLNFDIEITWSYGWKHFFGFNDLSNTDDVLFIGIVRNLSDWVNSLYREKHHLKPEITKDTNSFLNNTLGFKYILFFLRIPQIIIKNFNELFHLYLFKEKNVKRIPKQQVF